MNAMNISLRDKKRGRYVSGLLIQYGITQAELAEKTGLSQSFLSNIINGRRMGAKEKGKRARQVIADALGMKVEELWPKRAAQG
jgi:lambda repressor-like predicted transcriptional regulator